MVVYDVEVLDVKILDATASPSCSPTPQRAAIVAEVKKKEEESARRAKS